MADSGKVAGGSSTMHIGPLGSTVHILRADAGTVAALAGIDWTRWFRRVRLDPVQGLVTLMTPSRLHDELAQAFDDIVDAAASAVSGASKSFRTARLRGPDDPPRTGMEPDCAFYLDERARAYIAALARSEAAAEAYFRITPPDLVVEVEITHGDEGRIERYRDIGVRELWRLDGRQGSRALRADFLALQPGTPARSLAASEVLAGLTPADVCEAVERVRLSGTRDERMAAVARIVRRRQRASVRLREEPKPFGAVTG